MFRFRKSIFVVAALIAAQTIPSLCMAADQAQALPNLSLQIGGSDLSSDGTISSSMKIVLLLTAMSFLPAVMVTMTCFTRIAVVLGMTRTALGTQAMPPNTVITGLSLFLTFAIMSPVFTRMYDDGIHPFLDGQMGAQQAMEKTTAPLKIFLLDHARDKDVQLFMEVTKTAAPEKRELLPLFVAVPAFVLTELNTAFQIGFLIALPFLVLDMVVSSVLTSMSMITLPPVVISLPLKMMLFVVVDGWHLIIGSLIKTYHVS